MIVGVQVHADEGTRTARIPNRKRLPIFCGPVPIFRKFAAARLSCSDGVARARCRPGNAGRRIRRRGSRLGPRGLSSPASRGSGRPHWSPGSCAGSAARRGFSSAPATTCPIPRPLGPIRDLAGSVSPALEGALAAGAAPHDIQTLLVAELELPPRPTVLVLEDVHWADDATLDAITVLGRRIGSLPALLVLTFRAGEVPPGHPLHATVGAIRADDSVVLELGPLSKRAVAVARRRPGAQRSSPRPAATRSTSTSSCARRRRSGSRGPWRTPSSAGPRASTARIAA